MNVSEYLAKLKKQGLKQETLDYAEKTSGIRRSIILAIVYVESRGNTKAVRYEKGFKWTFRERAYAKQSGITEATERNLQQMSWGLSQLMGGTARSECGYVGDIVDLLDPNINLRTSVHYLARLMKRYKSITDVISSYNQGSPRRKMFSRKYKNQPYVDKVLRAAWDLGYRGDLSKTY